MAIIILIGSLGLIVYVYAGYPLLLRLLGKFREKKTQLADITPTVSLIIAVHNEESVLAEKLENTLALDYPPEKIEILIALDGCTDLSEKIARQYANRGVRLLRLERCGKLRALQAAVNRARGEILAFSDANTWAAPKALRALAAHFADSTVGGVCGRKTVGRPSEFQAVSMGEGFYWKFEQFVKQWESRTGSTIAADGALYAIRRELFYSCSNPAQADDFAISVHIPISGKRLIFEPSADVWEDPPTSARQEFLRKMRIANHSTRSLWEARRALSPIQSGLLAIKLWSHKVLRYFVPLPLAIAWIVSISLANESVFCSLLLGMQCAFYTLAIAGFLLRRRETGSSPLLHIPFYFCLAHSAALIGATSALGGKHIVAWSHARAELSSYVTAVRTK